MSSQKSASSSEGGAKKSISGVKKSVSGVKSPEWLVPDYPPLAGDVGRAAVNGQVFNYPKVVRTMKDSPVTSQRLSLLSFMLFKEPHTLRDGTVAYGYVKNRGNWSDVEQAKFQAGKIIREVDSKYEILIAPTGCWMPITTNNTTLAKEQLDVRMTKEEIHLRDQAVKDKQSDQRRMAREIREREEELRTGGDIYDDPKSLDYYSMRMVTEVRLIETRDKQIDQVSSIKKTIIKVQKELKRLELEHPEYKDQWIDRYNEERRKAGVPDYIPSEDQMKEHDDAEFSDLDDSDEGSSSEDDMPAASSSSS